jgi:drug/metabolite transporter (DMT)-like permease
MDAVVLALVSAALFGMMTVAIRFALVRVADAEVGALLTILVALAVALPVAAAGDVELSGAWPFLLAGILGPGISQILFTLAIRDAGPSRTSVTVGTAPLFSIAIALTLLDEPAKAGVLVGAILIVVGGIALVREPGRPEHVKWIGLGFALGATVVFAVRDNILRHLSLDTEVEPALAASATLAAAAVTVAAWLLVKRRRLPTRGLGAFVPSGVLFGLSYLCLFEAYYRGRVSVVSPLVATESLWGVGISVLLLRRHELVGPRLAAGAALVVAGGALIGVFR